VLVSLEINADGSPSLYATEAGAAEVECKVATSADAVKAGG
jgi:hypothetical protein